MKIGFFGGSFNPPSNIHINLANSLVKEFNLDKVIFVPVGDYYKKAFLINAKHRYNMLKLATKNNLNLGVEGLAVESKIKLFATDTFRIIKEKYKNDDIFFIMGSDNFRKMPTWKNYEELINNYNIIVVEREKKEVRYTDKKNIFGFIPAKFETIDSTKIRNMIKNGKNVQGLLPQEVYNYIKQNSLYIM